MDRRGVRAVNLIAALAIVVSLFGNVAFAQSTDRTDWGRWRLGHQNDLQFLEANRFTVTFAGGAPHFERATRAEYDAEVASAIEQTQFYRDRGYLILRYMTSSVHGTSPTSEDDPQADQLDLFEFYHNGGWEAYSDLLGPKPPATEDPSTWLMVRRDGTFPHYRYAPYGQQTTGRFEAWGCPNNPHFRELMAARIRSQASTGVDGVYLDWTQVAGETCHCRHCQEGFRAFLHRHLPAVASEAKYETADFDSAAIPLERGEDFWMEWMEYRTHSLADFHRYLRAEARTVQPDFLISGNVYGGFGYGPIAYDAAGHMELFGRDGGHDFLYSEIQEYLDTAPHRTEEGVRISNSPALRYLSAAAGGRPVIQYATEITPPIFPDPTEKTLNAMAAINIAEAAANQTIFREKRETPEWATRMYNLLADNEEALVGARLDADIAVLGSIHQYMADRQSYAFSMSRVLTDRGIAHVFVTADGLSRDLPGRRVLIVPHLPLLSDAVQEQLVDYARGGGNLIVLGNSGARDEHDVLFAEAPLRRAGGADYGGDRTYRRSLGAGTMTYLPLSDADDAFLIQAQEAGQYTTFGPTLADRFADIPEGYTRGRIHPDLYPILSDAADRALEAASSTSMRLSDHPFVEVSTMRNRASGKVLAHLVNYDVSIYGDVNAARDVRVRVAVPDGSTVSGVRYATDAGATRSLDFEVAEEEGGRAVVLAVDEVEIYGLVIIDLE
jgi:hypothetical protein